MRSTLSAGLTALVLGAGVCSTLSAQGLKLAYVNTDALMNAVPGRAQAETAYNKAAAVWDAQVKATSDSLQKMADAYTKALPTMANDSVKMARQKPIQEFNTHLQELQQKLTQTAQAKEAELMAPLQEKVKAVLEDFRQENGYAFIFNVSSSGPAPFVAADKNLDVTDRVLLRLKTNVDGTLKRPPGGQ